MFEDGSEAVVATVRRHVETFAEDVAGSLIVVVEHVQFRLLSLISPELRVWVIDVG